jgi:prephenate dehydratase
MVCWFVVVQDDCDNVTRFLMLAREPVIPRNDRPFKVLLLFLQLCQWPFSSWFSFLE